MRGMALKVAPLCSLLFAGLIWGLLPAIVIYLAIRAACLWERSRRNEQPFSRKRMVIESLAFLLGGVSLATTNPMWFQLEITLLAILALAASIVSGEPFLSGIEPFPPASLIGEKPAGVMRNIFILGLIAAPIVNLWMTLQASETLWLLFRTLGPFLWVAGFTALMALILEKKAKQETS